MPFDPNIPINGTVNDADPIRANMNVLNARCDALAGQIASIPAGPPGPQGAKGDKGDQGEPGPGFPYAGNAEIDGTVFVQGELALFESDPGGSGESSVRIGRDTAGGISVPLIACRTSGMSLMQLKWDIGGFGDGMGNPTIQDGAIYRVDLMTQTLKPWNITVQTLNLMDSSGNPITVQVLVPPA